jgi:hypothetical protein
MSKKLLSTGLLSGSLLALCASGAVMTYAGASHAQVAGAEAAAQLRFQRGRELFVANDFNGALTEFRAANQLVASPNTRLYIARCLRGLGRSAEAYMEFQRAAGEAADRAQSEPRYTATRDVARQEMDALRPQIGSLTLHARHAPDGLDVRVAGAAVSSATFDVAMPTTPGTIEITATAPGRLPFRQEVEVRAGATTELSVELRVDPNYVAPGPNGTNNQDAQRDRERSQPPPVRMVRVSEGGGVRIGGFVVAAVGLGGLGAFIGFGTMASSRFADLRTVCSPTGGCGPELEGQLQEGVQFQTFANVGLVVGGLALVGGTVMIIAGGPRERMVPEGSVAATRARRPQWTAYATPSAGGMNAGVGGTF